MKSDREVFESLVDEHGAVVLAMLRRLCGNAHDAEDVFQDVAVRVWRNLRTRPLLKNARAWLLTIAYRAYLDHRGCHPDHVPLGDDIAAFAVVGGRDRDPVAVAERAEHAQRVNSAVAELSDPLRSVIVLHYTGGLSLREVAGTIGISVGTAKSRLNAGLKQLRRRLP